MRAVMTQAHVHAFIERECVIHQFFILIADAVNNFFARQLVENHVKQLVAPRARKMSQTSLPHEGTTPAVERFSEHLLQVFMKPPPSLIVDQVLTGSEKLAEQVKPLQRKASRP